MKSAQIKLSKPLRSLLIALFNYTMAAVFAFTLAYWIWLFFKPSQIAPINVEVPATQTLLPTILGGHWFGVSQQPELTPVEAKVNVKVKLVGVLSAGKRQPGFAIFELEDGKQVNVMLNQEVTNGVKLMEIGKKSVLISQNGVDTLVALEENIAKLDAHVVAGEPAKVQTPASAEIVNPTPVSSTTSTDISSTAASATAAVSETKPQNTPDDLFKRMQGATK